MNVTCTRRAVVEPGWSGVVAHVGQRALGSLADRLGLADATGEALAGILRADNARANTVADDRCVRRFGCSRLRHDRHGHRQTGGVRRRG